MTKSYLELIELNTFEERLDYLMLNGVVAQETFGFDRYINQKLYNSPEWRRLRDQIIVRDLGCDLAFEGYEIYGKILIHHINPLSKEDILNRSANIFDPNNLITVSKRTHDAIHYSTSDIVTTGPIVRTAKDTCLWK